MLLLAVTEVVQCLSKFRALHWWLERCVEWDLASESHLHSAFSHCNHIPGRGSFAERGLFWLSWEVSVSVIGLFCFRDPTILNKGTLIALRTRTNTWAFREWKPVFCAFTRY